MKYNLYPRPVKNGTRWYYWFLDEKGAPVRKSTGCAKKRDALAFIEKLSYTTEKKILDKKRTLFCEYAEDFFSDYSPIVSRWKLHGKINKRRTLVSHRIYLERYLMPWFSSLYLDEITAKKLDERLITVKRAVRSPKDTTAAADLSGSTKNSIKDTLSIILREALFDEKILAIPLFKTYARNSKRQNTLTDAEIKILFPFDKDEAGSVWSVPRDKDPAIGPMFSLMAAIAVSCGLRSGEVVALSREQIIPGKGLVIDREFDDKREISFPKKGTEADPRFRVVPMSDFTFSLLDRWMKIRGDGPGLLFTYHGKSVSGGLLLSRFKRALTAAGINTAGRRITFHGLRYTFNTKMKNTIPREMLRDIIGHKTADMTELYDRPVLEERLNEYREQILPAVNGFWKMA